LSPSDLSINGAREPEFRLGNSYRSISGGGCDAPPQRRFADPGATHRQLFAHLGSHGI